jgi:chemotaxis protein MotB
MARRKKHEEHENHERWLVSYADFITLLFAFFTVLYATSQADEQKQEKFEKSVRAQFAGFGLGMMGMGTGSGPGNGGPSQFSMYDQQSNPAFAPSNSQGFPGQGSSVGSVKDAIEKRLESAMDELEKDAVVTDVYQDQLGVHIQLAAAKFFSSGSADIRVDSLSSLNKISQILKEAALSGHSVVIAGHTDNEPVKTERFPSNWELSASRATKIVRYLILRHGIAADRLSAVAYADQRPLAPNISEENRSKNRRIEVLVEK